MIANYLWTLTMVIPAIYGADSPSSVDTAKINPNLTTHSAEKARRRHKAPISIPKNKNTGKIRFIRTDAFKFRPETRISIDVKFDPAIITSLNIEERIRFRGQRGFTARLTRE